MGLVINPRGTSGAGKTWLVQKVIAASRRTGAAAVPLHREGRVRPIGWRMAHTWGGRPLVVLGHYQATRGGTDTIPEADGGLDEAFRLADTLAQNGHDVLMEGYQLSGDVERTANLARVLEARGDRLQVLWLDVPVERCVRNVVARRRAGRDALPTIEQTARAGHVALTAACQALEHAGVDVERLDSVAALHRTLALLGLDPTSLGKPAERPSTSFSPGPSVSPPAGAAMNCRVEP